MGPDKGREKSLKNGLRGSERNREYASCDKGEGFKKKSQGGKSALAVKAENSRFATLKGFIIK